ncbi:MAG: D-alanyl-D-alanine carboxypeptidase family protein [Clostridia bacterium]|nr:D-alanyl-D-alanine carboxypeptidase family protein [Clostridia bacterium]
MREHPVFLLPLLAVLILLAAVVPCHPAAAEAELPVPEETAAPAEAREYVFMKYGAKGDAVRELQTRLAELGYYTGKIDGSFGEGTQTAVRLFQRYNGLDVDGMAGNNTQSVLWSDAAVPAPEPAGPVDVLAGDLPLLVNKEHPVDEDFVPDDLVLLTDIFSSSTVKIKYKKTQGVRAAAEALFEMLSAAQAEGLKKWQISAGYRTWADQNSMLESKISSYRKKNTSWGRTKARNAALKTVAEPGCSEHHLGLAFDVNVPGASSFAGTKQCKWLHEHCWEYGFIVRYPAGKEDITGFSAEAWHVRYVGTEHSLYMRDHDLCLEEYMALISSAETDGGIPEDVSGTDEGIPDNILTDPADEDLLIEEELLPEEDA